MSVFPDPFLLQYFTFSLSFLPLLLLHYFPLSKVAFFLLVYFISFNSSWRLFSSLLFHSSECNFFPRLSTASTNSVRCEGPQTPHLSSVNVLKCSITLCYVENFKKRKAFDVPSCVSFFRAKSHINNHKKDTNMLASFVEDAWNKFICKLFRVKPKMVFVSNSTTNSLNRRL